MTAFLFELKELELGCDNNDQVKVQFQLLGSVSTPLKDLESMTIWKTIGVEEEWEEEERENISSRFTTRLSQHILSLITPHTIKI